MPKITEANFHEGAYRRGLTWDVFDSGRGSEIQRVDVVEHPDTDEFFQHRGPANEEQYNPWFADDDEAALMVCFLAADGDADAIAALREIDILEEDIPCPR